MIVKFFKKRSKGKASSCKACIDYLLNKPDDTAQILQGDPRLSQAIADSLDFNNTYTAGCLSFEEPDIPEENKQLIIQTFDFDKTDRPLIENFKQVTNYAFDLTDPNDPSKKQIMVTKQKLPSDKKQVLQTITDGLTALDNAGQSDRKDVINALERAGFEITCITPKNISIKTDGQNLRLKGQFYEQDFRFSQELRADITERAREYKRDSAERYQTAR